MLFRQGKYSHLFCATLLALSIQSAYASTPAIATNSETRFNDGFYGGFLIGAGLANAEWKGSNNVTASNNAGFDQLIYNSWTPHGQENQTHFAGRVFVGYNLVRSNLYLGGEMGGTFAQTYSFHENNGTQQFSIMQFNTTENLTETTTATSTPNAKATLSSSEFNLDIKPGIIFKDRLLFYARAGLAFNKLELSDTGTWTELGTTSSAPIPAPPLSVTGYSTHSKNVAGLRLGLGIEYLFTSHLSMLLDYTYTNYGMVNTVSEGAVASPPPPPFISFNLLTGTDAPSVFMRAQTAMIGLNYHF